MAARSTNSLTSATVLNAAGVTLLKYIKAARLAGMTEVFLVKIWKGSQIFFKSDLSSIKSMGLSDTDTIKCYRFNYVENKSTILFTGSNPRSQHLRYSAILLNPLADVAIRATACFYIGNIFAKGVNNDDETVLINPEIAMEFFSRALTLATNNIDSNGCKALVQEINGVEIKVFRGWNHS